MPARVCRDVRVEAERNEPEVRRRELPPLRVARRVARACRAARGVRPRARRPWWPGGAGSTARASRRGPSVPPGSDHMPAKRIASSLPEEHLQHPRPHLEHDRERDVCGKGGWGGRLSHEVIDSEAKTSMSAENGTPHQEECDLVVVGGGVAGLVAALCAAAEGDVLVLTKGPLLSSLEPCSPRVESRRPSAATTLPRSTPRTPCATGRGLCRRSAVAVLTEEAPVRIRDLVELGVEFDEGLGLEGGHSRRRVVHAGGAATGDRVARVLAERVLAHPRIRVAEGERMRRALALGRAVLRRRHRPARCRCSRDTRRHGWGCGALAADDESPRRPRGRNGRGLPGGSGARRSRVRPVPSHDARRLVAAALGGAARGGRAPARRARPAVHRRARAARRRRPRDRRARNGAPRSARDRSRRASRP